MAAASSITCLLLLISTSAAVAASAISSDDATSGDTAPGASANTSAVSSTPPANSAPEDSPSSTNTGTDAPTSSNNNASDASGSSASTEPGASKSSANTSPDAFSSSPNVPEALAASDSAHAAAGAFAASIELAAYAASAASDANASGRSRRLLAVTISPASSPSKPPGAAPSPSPGTAFHGHRRQKHKVGKWVVSFFIGSIAGVFSGLVVSVLLRLLLNCLRGRIRNRHGTQIFSPVIKSKEVLSFLEKEDGLTDLAVIGRGGCGEVYLKDLGSRPLAIKKIRMRTSDAPPLTDNDSRLLDKWMRQIWSEIRTVGRIRHRNLVPLLAHVSRPDCHYLVYEYMRNGSLHDAIRDAAEGRRDLGWPARYRVATGIAAGLEHLHVHHRPHIIHRDLKPGNVLLDETMEPRIADFGFAKEVPDAYTHMSTSNVAGTVGYIAPEYYQTIKYTAKCDVYSFGVILCALVTGREPSDEFFVETEEMSMVKWMRNRMREGEAAACFDRSLVGKGDEDKMELTLRVACFCTADDPKERPDSKEVRLMLEQIPAPC